MKILFNNLEKQWSLIKSNCLFRLDLLFSRNDFILGKDVIEFEKNFANFIGCKYAVGVSNGTDAIKLAAEAINIKSKKILTIIPANTYIATIFGIENALDTDIILIDCDQFYQMDADILEKTIIEKHNDYDQIIIVPVHLYGYACNMDKINDIKDKYNCIIIEDASQAHGAKWNGQNVGTFGDVSAFSLYPGKNLGAAGDAGIVCTNNIDIYNRLLYLRNLGSIEKYYHIIKGYNNRLDTLQAIILDEKLKYLEQWNSDRRRIINVYNNLIKNKDLILPQCHELCLPVHHIFPILVKQREKFQQYLTENGIQHGIHYPILIEETPMYGHLVKSSNPNAINISKKIISLPIHPFLTDDEILYLCDVVNNYRE